jgi:hypothetical protein
MSGSSQVGASLKEACGLLHTCAPWLAGDPGPAPHEGHEDKKKGGLLAALRDGLRQLEESNSQPAEPPSHRIVYYQPPPPEVLQQLQRSSEVTEPQPSSTVDWLARFTFGSKITEAADGEAGTPPALDSSAAQVRTTTPGTALQPFSGCRNDPAALYLYRIVPVAACHCMSQHVTALDSHGMC